MPSLRFVSMPTEVARAFQDGAPDAYGQPPEHAVSSGGAPCRHCQKAVPAGAGHLILAYRPFPALQPYAETGPIFLCADPCERYPETATAPPMFSRESRFLLKAYGADDRILYRRGDIVEPARLEAKAADMLAGDDVAYVHVRSALNNCYWIRIERA